MSPEQATAEKEITARSDVYSLGSVLYEMLAGQPPHLGGSAQQIIMKIIAEEAQPLTKLRKTVPANVAAAVAKSLEKLPADRFASAKDFADALADAAFTATTGAAAGARSGARGTPWRRTAIVVGVAALGFAMLAAWALLRGPTGGGDRAPVEFAFRIGFAVTDRPYIAISPDGRRIIEGIEDSAGAQHIIMRELGSTALVPIPGTEGGGQPAFSPDGTWIAFVAGGKLCKVPVGGGPATVLADSVMAAPSWGVDGTILYARAGDGLWRVPESGGASERLTTMDPARREWAHWYPQALPGGRAAIFNNFSTPLARSRIEAVEFATGRRTVLLDGAVFARYVASGHLLFVRDGAIFAVRFDPAKLKVLGAAVPVLDDVAWVMTDGVAGYAVAGNGTLVYLKASEWDVDRRVSWIDRAGNERPALPEAGQWAEPRLSPDGRWIAITRLDPTWQIWLFDLNRRVMAQLTRSQGVSFNAVWWPDSRSIVYTSETPVYDLHRLRIDGGLPDTVVASARDKFASSVSPDGRTVVYAELAYLMLAPVGGGAPTRLDNGETSQGNGGFSPDGRWLVYEEAGTSGRSNVYVRALNGPAGRRQVSDGGGNQPRWSRGGREIVYRQGDAVLSASFQPATGEVGTPALLFRTPDAGQLGGNRTLGYDVTPDGSRFLMVTPIERPGAQPTVVILNWLDELTRRVRR
jgi:serine/threonine-protein kinase